MCLHSLTRLIGAWKRTTLDEDCRPCGRLKTAIPTEKVPRKTYGAVVRFETYLPGPLYIWHLICLQKCYTRDKFSNIENKHRYIKSYRGGRGGREWRRGGEGGEYFISYMKPNKKIDKALGVLARIKNTNKGLSKDTWYHIAKY